MRRPAAVVAVVAVAWAAWLASAAARGALAADAAPPPAPGDGPALLKAFFAEPSPARRAETAARFGAVAPKSWTDLKALLHAAAPRQPLAAGRHAFEAPADAGAPPIRYLLRVPQGYAAEPSRGWPLIVSSLYKLSGGPEPSLEAIEGWLGPDLDRYLIAVAHPPKDGPFEPTQVYVEHPLRVLYDVRQRTNVDSDRAILMGHLKSGYLAWTTALFSPGEWAAAVPIMSRPFTEAGSLGCTLYMPNVLTLAVQAHWGSEHVDPGQKEGNNTLSRAAAAELKRLGATRFDGIEYPGEGRIGRLNTDRLRPFLDEARRDAFPADGRLVFHRLYQGRAWGVRATALSRPEFEFRARHVIKPAAGVSPEKALENLFTQNACELTVRVPPGQNLVAVTARGVKEVEIELPAEGLDFSRPVRVTLNSRSVAEGLRKVDWAELLETARRTGDFERLVAGRLRAPAAGR